MRGVCRLHPGGGAGDEKGVSFRPFRAYCAFQLLAISIYSIVPGGSGWMHIVWQLVIGWTAAGSAVAAIRHHRPTGAAAWYLFAGGVFLNCTGILVAAIDSRFFGHTESPMLGDAFWLSLYPALVVGMGLLIRRRTVGRDWTMLVDTITISTGLGLLSWVFMIRPQAMDPRLHMVARAIVGAYPVSDMVVLALMVRLLLGGSMRIASFKLMVGALVGFLGTDIGWAVYSHLGQTPSPIMQRAFEMGSLVGYALVGAAAVHPSVAQVALPAPRRRGALSPLLLGGLTMASLIAPAVLIFEAFRNQIIDGVAIALCSAVLFLLVVVRMVQLVRRVELRTAELAERNRSVRRVLDTVNEGLLTVSGDGWLAEERSAMIDRWFKPWTGKVRFTDYMRAVDEQFADAFELGHQALREGTLPAELCLDQMPARLRAQGRAFHVGYLPIDDEDHEHGLLVVIHEVTAQLKLARQEAEQRELLAMFQYFARDRTGFVTFFDEATQLIERSVWVSDDRLTQGRLIHTLKGNASLAGLHLLAELCHEAEDELDELPDMQVTPGILALRARWLALAEAFRELVGEDRLDVIELHARELDRLTAELKRGLPAATVAARLETWRCEPVERSLERLAEHARALTQELGKGEAVIEIECPSAELRLDPRRWAPLWTELVHVVRNAVDHGFETQEERRAGEKPPRPRLRLGAFLRGSQFTIEIEDDGRGIDWAAIERSAVARGLPAADEHQRLAALLAPGVSTRDEVSATSGRGVGMAAVQARVRSFEGTMAVDSRPGAGTCWRFSFPGGRELSAISYQLSVPESAPDPTPVRSGADS
jgi:HPt (histidine-containing phosphotransfer) domain-containing protein